MDAFSNFINGLLIVLQPNNLLYCFIGVSVGTLVGVLPGIGPAATVAILLPITFTLPPAGAIIMLCAIGYGSMFGGSTTSILVNVPGEVASVVTCIDGYQMALKGRAGPALGIAAFGSFIAGTLAIAGMMFLAPNLARVALKLGQPEYFSLMLMSLMMAAYLVQGSMGKSLIMVAMGLFLGVVGMDPVSSKERFTFGLLELVDGISLIPMMVGMFGVAEVLDNLSHSVDTAIVKEKIKSYFPNRQDWKDSAGPMARGTVLGFFMAILPGVTPALPTFISYALERKVSKHPERFGTGAIEGVAGPEACNNASAVGGFIPLLSLGIPSNPLNAVILAALLIFNLNPGPTLIRDHPDIFWGVIASLYVGNFMLLVLNLPLIPIWVKVLQIPYTLLSVLILMFCFLGAYSINNSVFDFVIAFIFGIFGYVTRKNGFPAPPLVLAFLLGPIVERRFCQSLIISGGSFMVFINRPISAVFLLGALGVLITAFLKRRNSVEETG